MLTSPVVCSLATVLVLPVGVLAQYLQPDPVPVSVWQGMGMLLIAFGFVALALSGHGGPNPKASDQR